MLVFSFFALPGVQSWTSSEREGEAVWVKVKIAKTKNTGRPVYVIPVCYGLMGLFNVCSGFYAAVALPKSSMNRINSALMQSLFTFLATSPLFRQPRSTTPESPTNDAMKSTASAHHSSGPRLGNASSALNISLKKFTDHNAKC